MAINKLPLSHFTYCGFKNSPKYLPAITPITPAKAKASTTPSKTENVDFDPADAAKAANWVLSPISAIKIIANVEAKTFQSTLTPIYSLTLRQPPVGSALLRAAYTVIAIPIANKPKLNH